MVKPIPGRVHAAAAAAAAHAEPEEAIPGHVYTDEEIEQAHAKLSKRSAAGELITPLTPREYAALRQHRAAGRQGMSNKPAPGQSAMDANP
jgi:hypothetical protein